MTSNLYPYGSPSPVPMIVKHKVIWDEEDGMWVASSKYEGCEVKFFGVTQEEALEKLKDWVMRNKEQQLEPEF